MGGMRSERILTVALPPDPAGRVSYLGGDGTRWANEGGALPKALTAAAVWARVLKAWKRPQAVLVEVGSQLGEWLFDSRARELLRREMQRRADAAPAGRIEILLPFRQDDPAITLQWAEWPWELARVDGVPDSLGVQRAFTLVRTIDRGGAHNTGAGRHAPLAVEAIGASPALP